MAKTYARKQAVATRYSTTPRNVDRMVDDGRIPGPTFWNGRFPLWDVDVLDETDRRAAVERPRAPRVLQKRGGAAAA